MADLGQEAKLYYGAAGSTATNLIGIVKLTEWSFENEAVESKYRDSGYVDTNLGTTKLPAKITLRRKVDDAGYMALKAAAKDKTAIALKFLKKTGSSENCDGDFVVTKFRPTPEDMDAVQEAEFELALNTFLRNPTIG